MKQPLVRPKVILLSLLFSLLLNLGLYIWIGNNSLNSFRFTEGIYAVKYRINDLINRNYIILEKEFDELVNEYDLKLIIAHIKNQWTYTNDSKYWDVANPPVKSFLTSSGDCDDYARLVTYILHTKGHALVYYVMLVAEDSGHATAVYYDLETRKLNIIDVDGFWISVPVKEFDELVHIPRFIKGFFVDTVHIDIRTWDTRRSIATITVKEISTDAIFSR